DLGGAGGVTQNGAGGTLLLNGRNTYTGGTTINAGTISIFVDANLGAPTAPPVTLTGSATLEQAVDTGFTLNGPISGPGSLALNGDGGGGGLFILNAS